VIFCLLVVLLQTLFNGTSFLFSLSWARIYPTGESVMNQKGVDYYNSLINSIVAANLTPVAVLYGRDIPQVMQQKYGGWTSAK
jgi:beta-glucosidase/6-phospho-beta-glucosidase/beta-galactosidase